MVKVGLLGLGHMGQNHLRNLALLKEVEISFVYDIDEKIAGETAKKHSLVASKNLEQDLQQLDGVIIATPTSTHYEYIQVASRHVKNIFIEKPVTNELETTYAVRDLVDANNINCQVGFIERYNPAVDALAKLIEKNKNVINIDFVRTNKVSSRITDVGVVIDLMIHDIDLAIMLNGKPKDIYAQGHVKNGLIEFARANLTHENGAFSNIVASRITEKRHRQISVTCNDMYIDCNLLSKELFVNRQTVEQYMDDVSISSRQETIDIRLQESLLLELLDFVRLCQGVKTAAPLINSGVTAMEVASAIKNMIKGDA